MCQTNKIAGQVSEDMIGCLCWFYVDREQKIGILTDITKLNIENSDTYYIDDCGHHHLSCRPVKPDEVKLYDDNRYNCCAENEELRLKLVKLESDIKIANKNAQHWFDVAKEKSAENVQLLKKVEELKPKNQGEMYISVMDCEYKSSSGKKKRYTYYQFKPFGEYIAQFKTFEEAVEFKKKWMKENEYE